MHSTQTDQGNQTYSHDLERLSADDPLDAQERMFRICRHIITFLLDGKNRNKQLIEMLEHKEP